jgi:hypothetical protein
MSSKLAITGEAVLAAIQPGDHFTNRVKLVMPAFHPAISIYAAVSVFGTATYGALPRLA